VTPRPIPWTIVAALLAACAGCSTPAGSTVDRWIASQGGTVEGPGATRLRAVAGPLVDRYTSGRGSLHLLDSDVPGAFAWPDGRIFVSRGLLTLMNDQAMTAAVAHELGHLLAGGHLDPPASVRGRPRDSALEEECRADAIGVRLLRENHVDAAAMPAMLAALYAATRTPAACRDSLRERADRLTGVANHATTVSR
jgi:predicted Zn-dependent protease